MLIKGMAGKKDIAKYFYNCSLIQKRIFLQHLTLLKN